MCICPQVVADDKNVVFRWAPVGEVRRDNGVRRFRRVSVESVTGSQMLVSVKEKKKRRPDLNCVDIH